VLHLLLIVPDDEADGVLARLHDTVGVAHVVRHVGAECRPPGVLLTCDVVRESANGLIEWLQDEGIHRRGAITVHDLETAISDAAQAAAEAAPGHAADALVWEEIEAGARDDGTLTVSFVVFMMVASMIATVGLLVDSTVLIVGAMVIGPEYGPLSALCVAATRRRARDGATALRTFLLGRGAAVAAAFVAAGVLRVLDLVPAGPGFADRRLTAFISQPDVLGALVAVLAGVVGMLSLTQARASALVGVFVSVTTIPAAAAIGTATAYGSHRDLVGGLVQLTVNVAGLVLAGTATLLVQARVTGTVPNDRRAGP
jgi:uncharacterized hydrophobic protein (TIGR00271 family)